MQAPYSTDHLRVPLVLARAVEPNRRLRQLINMSRALTAQEWAELRAFEEKTGEES